MEESIDTIVGETVALAVHTIFGGLTNRRSPEILSGLNGLTNKWVEHHLGTIFEEPELNVKTPGLETNPILKLKSK